MPNPPKQYGAPTGVEKPQNQGRTQPGPNSDYVKHMLKADAEFHARQGGGGGQPGKVQQRPKGSSASMGGLIGIGSPKVPRRTEEEIDKQSR